MLFFTFLSDRNIPVKVIGEGVALLTEAFCYNIGSVNGDYLDLGAFIDVFHYNNHSFRAAKASFLAELGLVLRSKIAVVQMAKATKRGLKDLSFKLTIAFAQRKLPYLAELGMVLRSKIAVVQMAKATKRGLKDLSFKLTIAFA